MKYILFEVSGKIFQLFTDKKNIFQSLEICKAEKRLLDLKSIKKSLFFKKLRAISTELYIRVKCIEEKNIQTGSDCFCLFENNYKKVYNKDFSNFMLRVCSGDDLYDKNYQVLCQTSMNMNTTTNNSTSLQSAVFLIYIFVPLVLFVLVLICLNKKCTNRHQMENGNLRKENVSLFNCYSFKLSFIVHDL